MRQAASFLLVLAFLAVPAPGTRAQTADAPARVRHSLSVTLDPATHHLTAVDHLTLPAARRGAPAEFLLNATLTIGRSVPAVREVPIGDLTPFFGINGRTPDAIGPEGVYLAGSGFWYPQLDTDLIEFSIQARSPDGWQVISQGAGTSTPGPR